MSEYQYYEFVAIDRSLTEAEQDELRAVSTRGQISSTSFVNEYQWGDLKADPRAWMERYFDAHLYLTNWATHRVALRLPLAALDPATAARYCSGNQIRCWTTRTHLIFDLYSNDEEGTEDWVDPQGRLAAIAPIRAELAQGDLRPLYLMWLLVVQDRELDEDEVEPSVPPGLDSLSGAQRALADFLRLDSDLLAAAATASEPLIVKAPSTATLRRWVKGLPEADKDTLLLRVLQGEGPLLRSEMLRRLHGGDASRSAQGSRTVGELLAGGEAVWAERQKAAKKRETKERLRREKAAAVAQARRLDLLARDPESAWEQVDTLIGTKRPREYDTATALLADLHALAARHDDLPAFAERMTELRALNARKTSLIDRFDRVQLP